MTNTFRTQPEQIAVECGSCSKFVSATVNGSVYQYDAEADLGVEVLLATCPACEWAVVVGRTFEQWGNTDDVEVSGPRRLWPLPARELSTDAPHSIRRDFDEAQRCMSVSAYTAAAILARRLLEGIAVDLSASGNTLASKLTNLRQTGAIDGRLAEWADALRVVGNDAAHKVDTVVSYEDAADVLSFAEAMADYVYTFRIRYERFLQRRNGTAGPTVGEP